VGLSAFQEQSTLCSAHVTGIGYRPALRYPTSYSIPLPVKRIQAQQSQVISYDDEDYEWKVIAEYATNRQQAMDAHEIVDDIYRYAENFMHESGTVMQPDYVGKPENLYHLCLIGETKTPSGRVSDVLLLRMRHWYTHYRDKAVP
jgi:hypothetical protein